MNTLPDRAASYLRLDGDWHVSFEGAVGRYRLEKAGGWGDVIYKSPEEIVKFAAFHGWIPGLNDCGDNDPLHELIRREIPDVDAAMFDGWKLRTDRNHLRVIGRWERAGIHFRLFLARKFGWRL